MPFLTVNTNVELNAAQKSVFLRDAAKFIADQLHKPIAYVIITYNYNPDMNFGGNNDSKGILAEIKSIGFPTDRVGFAKLLTEFLYTALQVDLSRINVEYIDLPVTSLSIGGRFLG